MTTKSNSFKPKGKRRRHSYMPCAKSLANLIPLTKGHNNQDLGNHHGYSLRAELRHALDKQKRLEFVNSTIEGAIKREPTPFKEVWDRVDGKLTDTHLVAAKVIFEVIYRDKPKELKEEDS